MKKLSVGAWITCIAAVLAIVALFIFMGNVSSGYFKDNKPAGFEIYVICGAIALVAAIALITLVGTRVEGLGFIYFSNADVAKEVQTAENLASGSGAIASMAVLGCSMLLGIVGAFCNLRKKDA